MIFRRKSLPEPLQVPYRLFSEQVERMEQARDALMSCLPVGRVDPAPVAVGLDLLSDTLDDIVKEMAGWRLPEIEKEWQGCVEAIEESRAHMPHAHEVASGSGELEELLAAIEDVDEPLGYGFQQAELRWRTLRR